jgi:hypothetical protein
MKKIQQLSLVGRPLSKQQQREINGGTSPDCNNLGGGSCWHNASWTYFECGMSQTAARDWAAQNGGYWCTASCKDSCVRNAIA